jgi:hypothetical protein
VKRGRVTDGHRNKRIQPFSYAVVYSVESTHCIKIYMRTKVITDCLSVTKHTRIYVQLSEAS